MQVWRYHKRVPSWNFGKEEMLKRMTEADRDVMDDVSCLCN